MDRNPDDVPIRRSADRDGAPHPPGDADAPGLAETVLRALSDRGDQAIVQIDASGRLVRHAGAVTAFLPELDGHLLPGAAFADLLAVVLAHHPAAPPPRAHAAWIARRVAPRPGPRRRYAFRTAAGRWVLARECGTEDGGTLVILAAMDGRRRLAERCRRTRRDLAAALEARNETLARLSRDLRAPLDAIVGFSEILASEAFGPLGSPRYRAYARDIHDGGTHLHALVANLRDLARIGDREMAFVERSFAIDEAVSAAVAGVAPEAGRAGVMLGSDIAPGLPLLLGDADALHQMVTQLLANAIRFTPAGGQVLVSASRMPDGGLALMVADTGPGIPADERAGVLEPFGATRGAGAGPGREGFGLGLPLTRRLMELHDGRLELESETGLGTTAILLFPPERSIPREAAQPVPIRRRLR